MTVQELRDALRDAPGDMFVLIETHTGPLTSVRHIRVERPRRWKHPHVIVSGKAALAHP
jgi:hypothetical protein